MSTNSTLEQNLQQLRTAIDRIFEQAKNGTTSEPRARCFASMLSGSMGTISGDAAGDQVFRLVREQKA